MCKLDVSFSKLMAIRSFITVHLCKLLPIIISVDAFNDLSYCILSYS